MKPGKLLLCASLALFSITAQAQCPDMTGSYRFTGAEHPFYLVKIPGQSRYNAFFPTKRASLPGCKRSISPRKR